MAFKLPKYLVPGYSASKKPTIPVEIDRGDSIGRDITFACIGLSDAVSGKISEHSGITFNQGNAVFNSSSDLISFGDASGTTGLSKCTYISIIIPSGTGDGGIFSKRDSSNSSWQMWRYEGNHHFRVYTGGGAQRTVQTGTLSTDKYIACMTHDSTILEGFVDGVSLGTASAPGAVDDSDASLWVGKSYSDAFTFSGEVVLSAVCKRILTANEMLALFREPYKILKPAIDQYIAFDASGTGSTITGAGTPQATTATSTGSGTVGAVVTGSGSPQSEPATSGGTATRKITSSGSPQATTATSSGAAKREITSLGSPQSETATSSGVGLRIITGSATTQATTATSNGVGTVGSVITGSGSPTSTTATSNGIGLRLVSGAGSAIADTATTAATGNREVTSSGAPQSEAATSTGSGTVGNAVIGSGSPQSETATSTGIGLRVIIGSGSPQATTATTSASGTVSGTITGVANTQSETATSSGVALRIITGTGSPQATTATAYGTSAPNTTIHPGRIYTVEAENTTYTAEAEDRVYNVG